MKSYFKIFLNFLFILALTSLQVGFISSLPGWLSKLNLIIIFIIFVLELFDFKTALVWSLVSGLILDVYSFSPFGTYTISFLAMTALTNYLLVGFFTDRSLYSFLVLTFFACFTFEITFYIWDFLINFISRENYSLLKNIKFFINKAEGLIMDLIFVFLGFNLLGFATKKLKPVFLVRRKM